MKLAAQQILSGRESERLEFKSGGTPLAVIGRTVCAFLNASGGTLVIGVDEGVVTGIVDAKALAERVQRHLTHSLTPLAFFSVNVEEIEGKSCLVVDVPAGAEPPYLYENEIMVRVGPQSQRANSQDISALILQRKGETPRWERAPALGMEIGDLDGEEILRTAQEMQNRHFYQVQDRDDPYRILEQLDLAANGAILNSAVVLFAKNPARIYPQTRVRVAYFPFSEIETFADNRVLEGNAFSLVTQIEGFLRMHVPIVSRLSETSVKRTDTPAYPWGALREAMMNALVHRDYTAYDGSILIGMYPDRIEYWNPGVLPIGLSVQELRRGGISRPHNPDIAHIFFLRGLIERFGVGARRIVSECAEAGLPEPKWEIRASGIALTLRLAEPAQPVSPHALNPRQETFLQDAPHSINIQEYHRQYAPLVSERQARTDLAQLTQWGYLRRSGNGPSTIYIKTNRQEA